MGKLSKQQVKGQQEILNLIQNNDKFNYEELERIYTEFNEAYLQDVTSSSAFFTPIELAYDFALMASPFGTIIDMCAGIGVLSHAALTRDTYNGRIKKIICIERNQTYHDIGKKLLPQCEWICGDIFNEKMWANIKSRYGKIDCIISNPPFGKVSKTDYGRDWLKYKGADIDIASIEIALNNATYVDMILPPGSCTFRYSGRPYYQEYNNKKINKLKKETGLEFTMNCTSVDCSVYKDEWKNTKVSVECVSIDRD